MFVYLFVGKGVKTGLHQPFVERVPPKSANRTQNISSGWLLICIYRVVSAMEGRTKEEVACIVQKGKMLFLIKAGYG